MNVTETLATLCNNPDFISLYNERTGDNYQKLTIGQVFDLGTMYHCIKIKFPDGSGEIRLTDAYHDITFNNQLYLASGDFADIQPATESKEINNFGMNVRISGVREEYLTLIRSGMFTMADVIIDMVFLNPQTGRVEANYGVFMGTIDKLTTTVNKSSDDAFKNQTDIQINSMWSNLDKSARHHASHGVHTSYAGNENDTFFAKIGAWNSEAQWKIKK